MLFVPSCPAFRFNATWPVLFLFYASSCFCNQASQSPCVNVSASVCLETRQKKRSSEVRFWLAQLDPGPAAVAQEPRGPRKWGKCEIYSWVPKSWLLQLFINQRLLSFTKLTFPLSESRMVFVRICCLCCHSFANCDERKTYWDKIKH